MGASSYYRTLSPTGGRHRHGPRASTGMVQLGSSVDPYETPRGRYDDDYYYPSDNGYPTSHRRHASHASGSSRLEAQPISTQKYRDPGQPAKKRTEYTLQPQPKSRHRSNTTSATDLYETPVRLSVPSSGHLHPVIHSARGRSTSPLPPKSDRYLVPASSHHGKGHHRVYSNDYASDTGRQDPRTMVKHHSPRHGEYRAYPHSAHRRHLRQDELNDEADFDDRDVYSYTGPREQFDRDYPVKPRHPRGRAPGDRPVSMNVVDEDWPTHKDHRHHGPPPTSRGLDRIDRGDRPRASSRGGDEYRNASRSRGHDRALVALPHESDDGYDSYSDDRRHRRYRRKPRHGDHHHQEDRSPRPYKDSEEQVLPALGTAALGNGYADTSDYDRRSSRRHHPRDAERDYDRPKQSSKELHDGRMPEADRNKQLLAPGDHHRRSHRRSERHQDSDSDAYTDDEDYRKYRREPSADHHRGRHSSEETSSAEDHSSRHEPRDRRRHHPPRSERQLEDTHSDGSRHSPPNDHDSREDVRKPITVDPPTSKEPEAPPKGILKPPRDSFPEEPNPVREGVAPLKDANKKGIPPGARWTKIGRRLVNPEALEAGNERYEERADYVIVLRVLTKEEIELYALKTQEIRGKLTRRFESWMVIDNMQKRVRKSTLRIIADV